MHKEHKYFNLPDKSDDNTVWRYMDLWKFEDLIKTSELHMSTIKNMGDQYEGRIPDVIRKKWVKNLNERGLRSSADLVESMGNYAPILDYNISSWNINKNESYALWKIYTTDKTSVAIKSNVNKLVDSFRDNKFWQYIGKINYFNHTSNFNFDSNIMNLALNKFDYYLFENELRVLNIIPATEKEENPELNNLEDVRVKLCLDTLIDSVYLAPNATEEDFKKIKILLDTHNLDKDIYVSGIDDKWSNK